MWLTIITGESHMNLIWLVQNIFTYEMTVETSKTKKEVISSLKAYTDTKTSISNYNPRVSTYKLYIGHVDSDSFRIKKAYRGKYDLNPVINGSVDSKDDGASVYVRISLSIMLQIIIAIFAILLIYFIVELIQEGNMSVYINKNTLVLVSIWVISIIAGIISIKLNLRDTKRDIRKIVQGSEFREYH